MAPTLRCIERLFITLLFKGLLFDGLLFNGLLFICVLFIGSFAQPAAWATG